MTIGKVEVLLVNDGSTDKTLAVALEYTKLFTKLGKS